MNQQVSINKTVPYIGSSVEDVFDKVKDSPEFPNVSIEEVREGVRYLHSCVMIQCKYTDGENSKYYMNLLDY